ncbi:L-serine ammonia-lyase [Xanthobacter autotrophicus DSM 431]|uniref:L-serine ammonia-lyase n=1 Tax=Xanthobacter nonsaccharivorans TaxID=3119912 RepID=UPI00372AA74B
MSVSAFDLFRIGIGPSSSHTVGPMRAAGRFLAELRERALMGRVARLQVELFGSLALTGEGHGTLRAVVLGLAGLRPEAMNLEFGAHLVAEVARTGRLVLPGCHAIAFSEATDIVLHRDRTLPGHPNGMRFAARDAAGAVLAERDYYSVGGGFVVAADETATPEAEGPALPYPFRSAQDLLEQAEAHGLTIAELAFANEAAQRPPKAVRDGLDAIWAAMRACIERGLATEGELPGPFRVRRRAPALHRRLMAGDGLNDAGGRLSGLDWVTLFAIAVNEENAAGGRVVTAPTNGAAGIVPAVLAYFHRSRPEAVAGATHDYLLTAAAIGALYKTNASISGAEVGCQGEVGVACSMAAGGLAAVLGGTNAQIENAAEIGMEHCLGLTCDPVGGLVQIPCIERNALGAAKAITAAQLALSGDGQHYVTLDKVIETMRQTGADMQAKYKETSLGGLAVNVTLC